MAGKHGAFPGAEDEDALPWLEPAEADFEEDEGSGIPARALIIAGGLIVAVIALLWFVAVRFGAERDPQLVGGDVPVIAAPEGPYKVRPAEPGGLDVETATSMTHAVADGADPGSTIDVGAAPEEPVPLAPAPKVDAPATTAAKAPAALENTHAGPARPAPRTVKRPPAPQPKVRRPARTPAPKPATKLATKPVPVTPATPSAAGASVVQLGAFSSTAIAERVWTKLAARVGGLSAHRKSVEPVAVGDKTLYRLRASGLPTRSAASGLCAKVKAAGEQCAVIR